MKAKKLLSILPIFILLFVCICCRHPEVPLAPSALRVSIEKDPQTLDPRLSRDLLNSTFIYNLYEGLTRIGVSGQPENALADQIVISPDERVYTFHLKKSRWSDGTPVTAYDFEQTWKSLLNPHFPSPNAYQYFVIKGAKEAKEGALPVDQVAIKALDDATLVVELKEPTPYFLRLTAAYFYYPVCSRVRSSSSLNNERDCFSFNGPFQLTHWKTNSELTLETNPYYWDLSSNPKKVDKIRFLVLDNPICLQMFGRNELDWTGSPLSTIGSDALVTLKKKGDLKTEPAAGVYFLRVNVGKHPLEDVNTRLSLAMAIDRNSLVDNVLKGSEVPACHYIPTAIFEEPSGTFYKDNDIEKSKELFEGVLKSKQVNAGDFPVIKICYGSNERAHKIAQVIQESWKRNLEIHVELDACENQVYYDRLKRQDYQVSVGSWFADFADPISFLDVFKFRNNGTNHTSWESPQYISLLDQSKTNDEGIRKAVFKDADCLLMEESPIIPICFSSFNYLKQPYVIGVYFSPLGYLDFKNASIEVADDS